MPTASMVEAIVPLVVHCACKNCETDRIMISVKDTFFKNKKGLRRIIAENVV
jgi:hypothetical protein